MCSLFGVDFKVDANLYKLNRGRTATECMNPDYLLRAIRAIALLYADHLGMRELVGVGVLALLGIMKYYV